VQQLHQASLSDELAEKKRQLLLQAQEQKKKVLETKGKKVFTCSDDGCGMVFLTELSLLNHRIQVHKVVLPAQEEVEVPEDRDLLVAPAASAKSVKAATAAFGKLAAQCTTCGVVCRGSAALEAHMRTHTNDRPYVCTWPGCTSKFVQKSNLIRHLGVHTRERKFSCEFCFLRFTQKVSLRYHVAAKHTNARPFRCTVEGCQSAFPTAAALNIHMVQHVETRTEKRRRQQRGLK
jgi:hypothetical protein